MNKYLLTRALVCLLLLAYGSCQPVAAQTKTADYTFGGVGLDDAAAAVPTADGGLLIGGSTYSVVSGDVTQPSHGTATDGGDFWLVKLDAQGKKLWDRRFGGVGSDRMVKIIPAATGGFLLCGQSDSGADYDKSEASRGVTDYWVVKVDDQGNKQWDKRFGSSDEDFLTTAVASPDGGCLLVGFTGIGSDIATKKAPDGDRTEALSSGCDVWLVKIDAAGNKQWDKRLGGIAGNYVYDAVYMADGGFAIGALSFNPGGAIGKSLGGDVSDVSKGAINYWVIKVSATGSKQWDHLYGGSATDNICSLLVTPDGGLLLGGESTSPISGDKTVFEPNKRFWLLKLDAQGARQWDQVYGITPYDRFRTLQMAANGDYLLGGTTSANSPFSVNPSPPDLLLVRIAPNGQQRWAVTSGGDGYEQLGAIVPNYNGSILLVGSSGSNISRDKTANSQGRTDMWLVKLTNTTTPLATQLPASLTVATTLYPNPTTTSTVTLEVGGLRQQGSVKIELLTGLGQVVQQSVAFVQQNKLRQELDLSTLASGLYTLRIQTEEGMLIKQIVKR